MIDLKQLRIEGYLKAMKRSIKDEDDYFLENNEVVELKEYIDGLKEKVAHLKAKCENKDKWCQLIADIGFDYDGYRQAESLMKLIDELVQYALYARDNYDYNNFQEEEGNDK